MGGGLVVLVAVAATAYITYARKQDISAIREARGSALERGMRVETIDAKQGPKERLVTLLADVRPFATATLYAKVSGYLKNVTVDKGDRVDGGQVVAEIESPEIDQQYASAVADLTNKRRNNERVKDLAARSISTQVTANQAETDAAMAEANVAGLATMKSYQTVKAPFSGRVAARFADPGALITNAQTNYTSAQPLMTISDDSQLRIYAYIQQIDVPFVHAGDVAEVVDASNADRKKMATITRMTGELDQRTRTMLIEIQLDNKDRFLVPGSFAYVVLHIPIESYPQVPVSGVITRGSDQVVATIENETVRFRPIKVAATDGSTVSISDGLKVGERIAINLPDEVTNGSRVRPVKAQGR